MDSPFYGDQYQIYKPRLTPKNVNSKRIKNKPPKIQQSNPKKIKTETEKEEDKTNKELEKDKSNESVSFQLPQFDLEDVLLDSFIIVVGKRGFGKSTWALHLLQNVQPYFHSGGYVFT